MDTPVRVGKALIMTLLMASFIHNASAQAVIDVHSHSIPQSYRTTLSQHNALQEEGFPLPQWDVKAQLAWMDEAGVKTSVLTLAAPTALLRRHSGKPSGRAAA